VKGQFDLKFKALAVPLKTVAFLLPPSQTQKLNATSRAFVDPISCRLRKIPPSIPLADTKQLTHRLRT